MSKSATADLDAVTLRGPLCGAPQGDGKQLAGAALALFRDRLLVRIDHLAAFELRWIDDHLRLGVAEVVDVLPLMFWNWAASVRSCVHSPSGPNLISPTTVWNVAWCM